MISRATRRRRTLPALALVVAACVALVDGVAAAANTGPAVPTGGTAEAGDPAGAVAGPTFVPGEVVVRFNGEQVPATVKLPDQLGVHEAARALDRNPHVAYAVPDYIARVSGFLPNDPGRAARAGGWQDMQWNFLPCGSNCAQGKPGAGGIDALSAWRNLRQMGRAGAKNVTVAVVDTGVAFANRAPTYRRSPDFAKTQFTSARYDFVGDDRFPFDLNGHGTHVAGTIGERVNNSRALTGLAYNAKLMPIRALNRGGTGRASNIAAGIRYAAAHGADVINMSFEFDPGTKASDIPGVIEALKSARSKRAVLVAASGNKPDTGPKDKVTYPAAYPPVIAVGGVTIRGCRAEYSNYGLPFAESGKTHGGLDLVAPGGGHDANLVPQLNPPCDSSKKPNPEIRQLTLKYPESGDYRHFGYPPEAGTSMAAAHVSGVAAMTIARLRAAGQPAGPAAVESRLKATARGLGAPDPYNEYGYGLIDAAAATTP